MINITNEQSFIESISSEAVARYLRSLNTHRKYVREAGEKIGASSELCRAHDLSKYSAEELYPYADWFYGSKSRPDLYDRAWLTHIHLNPHHWQYWVLPPEFNADGDVSNGCLLMPKEYVLEMIADWMGANMAYQGTWDMTVWLKNNFCKIKLHEVSYAYLVRELTKLGYDAKEFSL